MVGTASGMETRLVPEAGYELDLIDRVPMPRRPSMDVVRFPARMRAALGDLLDAGLQVFHLTGRDKALTEDDGSLLVRDGYVQREYLAGMEQAYAAADLIVARSGAGTVCEVSAVGLPAVYVPLPIGNGEQALNARPVVEAEGALLVRDDAFGRAWVQRQLIPLATDPERLARMGEAAARFGVRDADVTMAGLVRSAAQEGARR